MSLYLVSYITHDIYSPVILEGPQVDDWQGYCDQRIQEAASNALRHNEKWIGWREIQEELVKILVGLGFQVVKPPEAEIIGAGIIEDLERGYCERESKLIKLLGPIGKDIVNHNKKFRKKLDTEVDI